MAPAHVMAANALQRAEAQVQQQAAAQQVLAQAAQQQHAAVKQQQRALHTQQRALSVGPVDPAAAFARSAGAGAISLSQRAASMQDGHALARPASPITSGKGLAGLAQRAASMSDNGQLAVQQLLLRAAAQQQAALGQRGSASQGGGGAHAKPASPVTVQVRVGQSAPGVAQLRLPKGGE